MRRLHAAAISAVIMMAATPALANFNAFLSEMRAQARAVGVSAQTIDRAFAGLRPSSRVVELDRRQPEFTLSFARYFSTAVSETRVENGRAMLARHRAALERATRASGVPPHVIAAFWGLETAYGSTMGDFDLIQALATLAYDPRRARFFRAQLLAALKIVDRGDLPHGAKASWAGAFGHMQFMPETFLRAAVDGDGDGRRDLMGDLEDAFQSAGSLLRLSGWKAGERWGREVLLPRGFDYGLAEGRPRPLADWADLGLARADGRALPADPAVRARLIIPAGANGPSFLVYDNFNVIMKWNRSTLYALAIGHLSDRIAGAGGLAVQPPAEAQRLRIRDIEDIQRRLAARGFDPGPADGKPGPATRAAIRRFQASIGLTPDGHPTADLLAQLKR